MGGLVLVGSYINSIFTQNYFFVLGPKKSKKCLIKGVLRNKYDFTSTITIGQPCVDVPSDGATNSIAIRVEIPNQKDKKWERKPLLQKGYT